jgi:hypothetical protein
LTPDQAACVSVLLQALADGKPEVAEAELLRKANVDAASIEELNGDVAGSAWWHWNQLIVPGETESTWRLKPPPEDAVSTPTDDVIEDAADANDDGLPSVPQPSADDPAPGEPMGDATFRRTLRPMRDTFRLFRHISHPFSHTFKMCG